MQGHGHILYFSDRQEINMIQEITTYTQEKLHPMVPKRMKEMYKSTYFYQGISPQRLKSMCLSICKFDSGVGRLQAVIYHASTGTCFSLPSCADVDL